MTRELLTKTELLKQLRMIRYYCYSKKKGITEVTVICSIGTVEGEYRKHRNARELGKNKPHFCDKCQYTSCWDRGKVIRCKEKKVEV